MKNNDIINFVRDLKDFWHTCDPYEIAKIYGIEVIFSQHCRKDFTAHTIKMEGYPTIISINDSFSEFSKKVLCAHELGHALLHKDAINYFATTSKNVMTNVEAEANLFAIALLTDSDINDALNIPLEKMNGYLLKSIMEYNVGK
jgi:Zn-dependent peptidase ImmA (M78 family)